MRELCLCGVNICAVEKPFNTVSLMLSSTGSLLRPGHRAIWEQLTSVCNHKPDQRPRHQTKLCMNNYYSILSLLFKTQLVTYKRALAPDIQIYMYTCICCISSQKYNGADNSVFGLLESSRPSLFYNVSLY